MIDIGVVFDGRTTFCSSLGCAGGVWQVLGFKTGVAYLMSTGLQGHVLTQLYIDVRSFKIEVTGAIDRAGICLVRGVRSYTCRR